MPSIVSGDTAIAPLGNQVFRFEVENGLDEVRRLDETASGTSTDLCPYFFSPNGCTRGDRCQWRHARNDKLIVCKHYLRGLCKKQDLCDYLHSVDYGRMPECFFFSKYGECSNAECPYRHVDPEKKRNECPYYGRGFCRHGPKCRHRHVKKVACSNYLSGFCKDGPDCVFGHARFEIARNVDDEDTFSNGIDRFGFGRSRGPAPRLITLENGMLATAAAVPGMPLGRAAAAGGSGMAPQGKR
ncbi:Putative PCSF-30 [Chondrus crispus]|uniref:Putative PCSF-30 n=1 Tax=Chondrus crispus TaxID=2769 RepID=R7QPX5_CHOCR|nr:Putative PCSF-30 [Chondrus crispus]CDF40532.1 Putative PCSF-30 [Chondrus crispus]|eukprot:XP_005710826.1 Putative PCSF-30 [Chondrus crispus]